MPADGEPQERDALELDALASAEAVVHATIASASEFVELPWSADIALSEESAERIWQVAGIAPLGYQPGRRLGCRLCTLKIILMERHDWLPS